MTEAITSFWSHGKFQLAHITAGVAGAFTDPLGSMALSITHSGDAKLIISTAKDTLGQVDDLHYMPKPTEVEFEITQATQAIFADFLLGTSSTTSRAADTGKTATLTLVNGQWVQIYGTDGKPIRYIDNVTITGKVEGTDFAVNAALGQIKALNSGAAGSKSVGYDLSATAGSKIVAGTQTAVEFSIQMETRNNATGENGILWIPRVSVLPSEAMKFINTDHQTLKFKGHVLIGKNSAGADLDLYTFEPSLAIAA